MCETLDRSIVQIHQRHIPARTAGQGVGFDDKAVVLGRDRDVIAAGVEDRMIAAAVPEFELDGIGSNRPRQQLMPQADAEVGQSKVEE